MNDAEPGSVELDVLTYESAGGTEHFISFEDPDQDLLIGFVRLRFPGETRRPELENAALVRELHVYGGEVALGEAGGADPGANGEEFQHQGYGRRLMAEAEAMAADAGYDKLSVISGIGAREYYREQLGYTQDGPYMSTWL